MTNKDIKIRDAIRALYRAEEYFNEAIGEGDHDFDTIVEDAVEFMCEQADDADEVIKSI